MTTYRRGTRSTYPEQVQIYQFEISNFELALQNYFSEGENVKFESLVEILNVIVISTAVSRYFVVRYHD